MDYRVHESQYSKLEVFWCILVTYQIIFLSKQPIANFGQLENLVMFMKPESLKEGNVQTTECMRVNVASWRRSGISW